MATDRDTTRSCGEPSSRPGRAGESGLATVLVVGIVLAVTSLLLGTMILLEAVTAAHRAAAAADLAALAAAEVSVGDATVSSSGACAKATLVAAAGRAQVLSCEAVGDEVTVAVQVRTRVPGLPPAVARARAGPSVSGTSHGETPRRG